MASSVNYYCRRIEQIAEEQPFPIKYRRVSNVFPKTYTRPIDNGEFPPPPMHQNLILLISKSSY